MGALEDHGLDARSMPKASAELVVDRLLPPARAAPAIFSARWARGGGSARYAGATPSAGVSPIAASSAPEALASSASDFA